uniref:Uncharacterized protein n=1 Tax=Haplochromis burtoni TaxID=8153 RepID=A0A3Q2WBC1_HAPBU
MNFSNVPSKAEVMGWNPQTLADYMRKVSIKTSLKVKVEMFIPSKYLILTIFDNILLVSVLHLYRVITKIQTEINKEERKKATSHK